MPTPEMPKELPSLNKIKTEDLRQWKSLFNTPSFMFFQLWLEKTRKEIANIMLSPSAMAANVKAGRSYEYFQGENAMINAMQAFFKDIEYELSARNNNAAAIANADNKRERRRLKQQNS